MRSLLAMLFIGTVLVSGVTFAEQSVRVGCSNDTPHNCE